MKDDESDLALRLSNKEVRKDSRGYTACMGELADAVYTKSS